MGTARAGFSYDSDIAPMRGDNFGGDFERRQQLAREENAVQIEQIKAAAENQARTGALEFERAKLALEAARRESQQQLDTTRLMPEISNKISGIMNDPAKDTTTRLMEIETTRQQYGTTVVQNPALNNLFNSAQTIVTSKNDQDKQRDVLAMDFVGRGDTEAIKGLYGGNVTAGSAKMFYDTATKVSESLMAKGATETEQRRGASAYNLDLDSIKGYEATLSSMKPKTLSDEEMQELVRTKGPDALANIKPELTNFDKIELREMYIDLNPALDTDEGRAALDSKPAEMLYGDTLKSLKQKRRKLTSGAGAASAGAAAGAAGGSPTTKYDE